MTRLSPRMRAAWAEAVEAHPRLGQPAPQKWGRTLARLHGQAEHARSAKDRRLAARASLAARVVAAEAARARKAEVAR